MIYTTQLTTWFAVTLVFPFSCGSAVAGPPFLTDDPEPVDYQHNELYIASQQTRTANGTTGTLPQVEYNYGAAPDVQLHIIVPYAFGTTSNGPRASGLGDIEIGVKVRFLQETASSPMVGIFPLVLANTGEAGKGLGNGSTQVFLPVWLQKKWGNWQSYGGGGYWINHAPGAKNHWFFGWQLQHDISELLTLRQTGFHRMSPINGRGKRQDSGRGRAFLRNSDPDARHRSTQAQRREGPCREFSLPAQQAAQARGARCQQYNDYDQCPNRIASQPRRGDAQVPSRYRFILAHGYL